MEPIGLVGTLIAIVDISSKLVKVCYQYRAGVKGARREISLILEEIIGVRTVVERLIDVVEQSDDAALPSLRAVSGPNALLQRCLEELKDLKTVLKVKGDLKSKSVALLWPLKQKEVEGRLAALSRIKANLQLALNADTTQNMVQILANTSPIPAMQRRLSNLANTLERTAEDGKKAELLAKLPARSMTSRHKGHYNERIDGTGDWLIGHRTYENWKRSTDCLLWLSGGAGSGKTVLCSRIIEDLRSKCVTSDDVAVLYFYIDGSEHQPFSINTLYCSFVSQLALQVQGVPRALDIHLRLPRSEDVTSTENLRSLYEELAVLFSKIYVVIDALDECQEFIELDEVFSVLTELAGGGRWHANILASSRRLEQLRRAFQDAEALHISMENDAVHVDFELALRSQLSGSRPFRRWPQTLRNNVEATLLAKARGSFYWMTCQLRSLKRCVTPAAVRERLQDLPQTLEGHYIRELERLESMSGQSVRNVLRWALSFRPLSIAELADAIAINIEDQDEPFLDVHLELFDIEAFLDSCSSLLTTHVDIEDSKHDQKVHVRFAHFSVLEFLRSDAINGNTRIRLTLEAGLVHSLLAKACLVYIHQLASNDADATCPQPVFMQYAASSWLKHQQLSHDKHWALPSSEQMLLAMFDAESVSYNSWLKYTSIDKPWEYDSWTSSSWDEATQQVRPTSSRPYSRTTPLYCTALSGLADVTEKLLTSGADPNVKCGIHAYALQAAAARGHVDIVKLLVAAGADLNADGGKSGSAIAAASTTGNIEIVRVLLDAGAKCQPMRLGLSDRSDDPLFMAVIGGHLNLVTLLLDHGAEDWCEMKGKPNTALSAAIQAGRLDIVRAMMRHERIRDANTRDTRLVRAYSSGLNQGLYYAAQLGHTEMLRELANELSDAEMLRYAARAGDDALFSDAMAKLPDIEADGEYSDHPRALQSAALGGHLSIVKKLLASRADPNLESNFSTPLNASIRGGNLDVAKALIEAGAKVHNDWLNPLRAAMSAGRQDFMELLISHGADTNPCLLSAVWEENIDMVRMLLEKGALPNQPGSILQRKNPSYPTLLATEKGNVKILTALLDAGAAVNQQDAEGFSAMHVAPGCPNVSCLRTLVSDYQADITLRLENGSQPIHSAASRGDAERVQILVDAGADVDAQNNRGRTPLHWAADKENCEVVELLLKLGANATLTADDGDVTAWDLMCLAAEKPWSAKRDNMGDDGKEKERAKKSRDILKEAMMVQMEEITKGGSAGNLKARLARMMQAHVFRTKNLEPKSKVRSHAPHR